MFRHPNFKMQSDLGTNLRRAVEDSQKVQHEPRRCRRRSEELIAEAERLFTKLELTTQQRPVKTAKGAGARAASPPESNLTAELKREASNPTRR